MVFEIDYAYYCVADVDYDSGTFDVIFGVGDTSAEVSINITDDSIDEGSEAFALVLKRTDDTPDFVEIVDPMNATAIIDDNDEPGMVVSLHLLLSWLDLQTVQ